jgi:2,3-bisphosphoglycerate-independent phosphoglycerate mutase
MTVAGKAQTLAEQISVLKGAWNDYDFFFIHYKYTDAAGEDGDFARKVQRIEEFDAAIPSIMELNPAVMAVTGDHSTPSKLRSHSWHPVPVLLVSNTCRTDRCQTFTESAALQGGLGQFEAKYLMPLLLAHAERLGKYGA